MSLRTKSRAAAARAARSVGQRLEDYWMGLRLKQMDVPALHLLIDNEADAKHDSPSMLEAVDMYLHLKASNDSPTFVRAAKRSGKYVVKALGNRPITAYSSADAAAFRDHLIESGLSMGSVKRIFGSVRSIINLVLREYGIEGSNAFSQTFMPDRNDTKDRVPIPIDKLDKLQHLCVQQNDDVRWLIALISDTGMRLSEAAGLAKTDINLNADIPYIELKPHLWRRLKTKGSQRYVPLVGMSLWAARQVLNDVSNDSSLAFPRYCSTARCNANSASGALNKWIKQAIGSGFVVHSLRHSLRDRLRAVECPSDITDQIGGWTTAGAGQGYGKGYSLDVMTKWMNRLVAHPSASISTPSNNPQDADLQT
jgi:integrase